MSKTTDVAILKRMFRHNDIVKDKMCKRFDVDGTEMYGFTNGYYILYCDQPYDYPDTSEIKYVEKCFHEHRNLDCGEDGWEAIFPEREKITEYKKQAKAEKSKRPFVYWHENGRIGFNQQYMLDCMDFVGTEVVYIRRYGFTKEIYTQMMVLINPEKNRMALLLPVHLV